MRPDDSSLSSSELLKVETIAKNLLHRSDAWGSVPVPLNDILAAAKLKVAPYSVFDPRSIKAYVAAKGSQVAKTIKSAVGKIFGILDASEELIHIDDTLTPGKQLFLTLHETGHFEMPHQRKLFRFFEDSEHELEPSIADQFEREANNFARFVMFNGDAFKQRAADMPLAFASIKKLKSKFKTSLYASVREYARTHHQICFVAALEPMEVCPTLGICARVRRVEVSPSYESQFGRPYTKVITPGHALWRLVPMHGRRVTRPTVFILTDLNGIQHEFVGEALDTTFNILLFACPKASFKTSLV
jgi:Zn-dependent peptidase ImmA (M78 family)